MRVMTYIGNCLHALFFTMLHLPSSNSLLRCVGSFGYDFCLNNLHAVSRPVNLRHGEAARQN
jgi:hypothetical protein